MRISYPSIVMNHNATIHNFLMANLPQDAKPKKRTQVIKEKKEKKVKGEESEFYIIRTKSSRHEKERVFSVIILLPIISTSK